MMNKFKFKFFRIPETNTESEKKSERYAGEKRLSIIHDEDGTQDISQV
jgi:hypothetical protein